MIAAFFMGAASKRLLTKAVNIDRATATTKWDAFGDWDVAGGKDFTRIGGEEQYYFSTKTKVNGVPGR